MYVKKERGALRSLIDKYAINPRFGCEVGVYKGGLSAFLLKRYRKLQLLLVDNYFEYDKESRLAFIKETHRKNAEQYNLTPEEIGIMWKIKRKKVNPEGWTNQNDLYNIMEGMLEYTEVYADRRTVMLGNSVAVSKFVPDESLDFVFIDAAHDYDSVADDIHCWFPKVRKGGLVSGHDYGGHRNKMGYFGVNRAVDEWTAEHGYKVEISTGWVWSFVK